MGGAERVALDLAAGLARRGRRAELWVAGPPRPPSPFEADLEAESARRGVPLVRTPLRTVRDVPGLARIAMRLVRERVPLVHAHNRPENWLFAALGRATGAVPVYTVHRSYDMTPRARLFYGAWARAVPRVVCVSRTVAAHTEATERVPHERVRVIYNGIDLERFSPLPGDRRAALRTELGWPDDAWIWITAARLAQPKGHVHLLDAFARLRPDRARRLALVGDGALRPELEAQAARLGIAERVAFLGPRSDVPALLSAADGYACASLTEGHPLSLLEAMALGLPIVAPRLESIVEIAAPDSPELYGPSLGPLAAAHDPADLAAAMHRVEGDPGLCRRAAAGRRWVEERFSQDAMIDAYAALYDELLARGHGRARPT